MTEGNYHEKVLQVLFSLSPSVFSHHAQEAADTMLSKLGGLSGAVDENISGFRTLQDGVQRDKAATEDLLAKGKLAQQVLKDYGNLVQAC